MLREAGLTELKMKRVPAAQCVFVSRKRGNDELAPSDELLFEFKHRAHELCEKMGLHDIEAHNRAFRDCEYERHFRSQIVTNPKALAKLQDISRRAETEDIYFVCYEGPRKACHRRILLRICQEQFGARVQVDGVEP
jgi:hypothetical protein